MVRFTVSKAVIAALVAAAALLPFGIAAGSVGEKGMQQVAEAVPAPARMGGAAAEIVLRFIQEDGPSSGHVRVELTPETRGLTILEARSAAQRGFLEALNEPGLGDDLSRIRVVVRLMPASHPERGPEQVFLFVRKGGNDWTILAGD